MTGFLDNLTSKASNAISGQTAPNPLDSLPKPPELSKPTQLLVALAATAASASHSTLAAAPSPRVEQWWRTAGQQWASAVRRMIKLDEGGVPSVVSPEMVVAAATDHFKDMEGAELERERRNLVETLVIASVFSAPLAAEPTRKVEVPDKAQEAKGPEAATLSYTPAARQLVYATLRLLSIPPTPELQLVEADLASSLFATLQQVTSAQAQAEAVEKSRAAAADGWGGKTGRWLATGAGVIAGGIAIGVTGGLAAPAIAALIPGFVSFGLLTTATAPVVLGSVFGLAGARLTGKRVRARWGGVEQFEFVEVHIDSAKVKEIIPDDHDEQEQTEGEESDEKVAMPEMEEKQANVQAAEKGLPDQLANTSIDEKSPISAIPADRRASIEDAEAPHRASFDASVPDDEEKGVAEVDKTPSLTATIVVPGLLTESPTEAVTAWQSSIVPHTVFKDGRDTYVLMYETDFMYKTGRALNRFVRGKIIGQLKKQVIKRTVLNAYFAAVKLPLSVYGMASMGLDNSWMQAQSKSQKAGRLLGEVLEKRVQGQRPVVLIGSSVGALTVLHALLYLSSRPTSSTALPQIVDSAYLISLPSAPSKEEWAACRSVVARRLVNAWSDKDLVLASIVR